MLGAQNRGLSNIAPLKRGRPDPNHARCRGCNGVVLGNGAFHLDAGWPSDSRRIGGNRFGLHHRLRF